MANFKVEIDFSTVVSEESADELEYLVGEFIQGMLNVVANDEYDQVADQIRTGTDAAFAAGLLPYADEQYQVEYHATEIPATLPKHSGSVLRIVPSFEAVDIADEGSDAPVEYYGPADYGSTDFDRR